MDIVELSPELLALQKTKIPARGLKPLLIIRYRSAGQGVPSKNQNPREGIETTRDWVPLTNHDLLTSKNQNPREGIETHLQNRFRLRGVFGFKKPKSPRGD